MHIFFRKNCFQILVSFWPFYIFQVWKDSLSNINITFIINFERKKVLNFQKQSSVQYGYERLFYRKIAHKILPKSTCNLIIKETLIQAYFFEFSKFLKNPSCRTLANGWFLVLNSFICLTP